MDLFLIIGLLTLGLLFIFLEIFFVPGTTVVGIVGLVLVGAGIYQVYDIYGPTAGHLTTGVSVLVLTAAIVIGFKSGAWDRFSSKDTITGRVNVREGNLVKIGDTGKAVSAIRGYGKARINGELFEVKGMRSFIDAGTPVEVVKVSIDRIYVQEIVEENRERTVGNSSEETV